MTTSPAGRTHGRLELTWTNKGDALLAHDDGGYEWVDRSDYRVNEVRLLHDAVEVGEVHSHNKRAKDNLLIRGDALHALTVLTSNPEFEAEYKGKVKLVYIDPPFNTGQAFTQYDDDLEHSVWLTMMRDRLKQIYDLLADDGSVWVHLDDAEMAYCKVLMDEVFGRANFVSTLVWQKSVGGKNSNPYIVSDHDYIIVYAKSKRTWRPVRLPRTERTNERFKNPDNDERGPWANGDYKKAATADERPNGYYGIVNPHTGQEVWPPRSNVWAFVREAHERNVADNRVWWGVDGKAKYPSVKRFLSEVPDLVPHTWLTHTEVGSNAEGKREIKTLFPDVIPFATPKPERLLERIIHIATRPGDVVLDCFAGSGSTAATAHKMGRRWVTVEWSAETLTNFTEPRLRKVVAGRDGGGVTTRYNWVGGGGFRVVDVAPSMFDAAEDGEVYLAEWATGSALAQVSAAQFGFTYEPAAPFCGRKGRMRLAVIDGLVSAEVVDIVVAALGDGERVKLVGTAVDPEARNRLAETSRGSTIRTVPGAMLKEYERSSALRAAIEARVAADRASQGERQLMLGEVD